MTASSWAALALVLVIAPALPGLAAKTSARLTGRQGAPVLQGYADLFKLLRKGAVYSHATTWVFRLAPPVVLGATLLAAGLVPFDGQGAVAGFAGDPIVFAGLLALGRFALVLAAFDTASSFEGMGASRELTLASFTEPVMLLSFAALALATGRLSLTEVLGNPIAAAWSLAPAALAMVAVSLFVVLLVEASRGPVDDPATHLELTMIHEVAVLDHGGPDLALLVYGSALKFAVFAALVVGTLIPRGGLPGPLAVAVLVPALASVAVLVGVIETIMARLRLTHVPQLLVAAGALSALGIVLLLH
jgi:formate hydrogenlyase subunit 4